MPLKTSLRIQELERKQKEEEEASKIRARELAVQLATGSQNSSNSNSTNSSTTSQKSSYGAQTVSNEPSAVNKLFESTARKYTNATANDSIRRNSRGQAVSGRDRTRSAVNSPNASSSRAKEDTGKWMKNEAYGALTGFNKELASAADFLLPDVITPDFIQKGLNYYRKADEEQQQKVQELRGDSKLREIAGTIGGETLQNIPSAAMAMLSGGTSVGAQVAGKAVPSLLEGARLAKTGNVVSRAMDEVARTSGQNPMFWETFLRTVGPTYDNEIENGADPVRATMSAYANALLNAQIEIGGGIEKYDPSEVFWKAALRSAKEEGMEEVQQYAVENLVNKAIGSNKTKDKNGNTIETPWFSMDRGVNAVINPVDMAEQGFYGAAAGGLMSGGRTLAVNAVNDARNNNYRQEHPDFEEHAKDLIQRASVQGREGEMSTRAQNLAEEVSEQMARGQQPTAYQMRELESAVATDEYYNQKAYENSSQERYNQAVEEGKADTVQQTGSTDEYYGFRRGLNETEQRNYDKAKAVMGENASENSVLAVSKLMTGSESNRDIDTILLDPEARSAVEEIAEVTLPINNVKARAELENIALVNQIANRDKILEQTHNDIRTNMSRRGGELFDDNYDEAVKALDVPNAAEIYENFFSRFYTAGTVEDADFEKTYNRIISPLVEDFGEDFGSRISQVFNHDFAQKVFAQGQIAMNSVRAKAQGRSLSVKASENPAGFTYEEEARKHISDREADLFTKLAERAKVHIRLVSSIAGGQANGSYDPETGVILIAADSDNKFITVFKHELTHHLKNTSPELYQKLEDFVFKKWYDGDPEKMEERVQEYQRRYNMRPDQAREEIIADASEAFFTDEGAINEAVTFNEKMARAIHDGIKSLLDTFLDLVDTDRRADKGYGDFLKDLDILRDAEKMWLEALNESVGKQRGSVGNKADLDAFLKENGLKKLPQTKKMSLKATEDSEGNRLTEGQKKFFKDSKVRDKDGNLLKVYHGTYNDFTVFKANEFVGEENGLSRIKGYFSTSEDYSRVYGHTQSYYLNIKNPLFIPDEWKKLDEWRTWFAEHGIKDVAFDSGIEEDGIKGYGYEDGTKGYALWDLFDTGDYWYGDGNLTEKIEDAGYDGIYWNEGEGWNVGNGKFIDGKPLAYMPFNENAIKRTDNLNPTEDKDIRYSIKDKDEIEDIGGAVTEGGTVAKYSLKSWNETDKKKLLQNLTEAGFTDKEAKKWIKQVNSVAAIIYGDMARLDYEADEYQDALKPNSEYFYTLDLSTLCAKRRLYQGTYNAIMKRMPDRAMMPEDTIRLRRMMADMRHEVPCGICYEESRKKNEGKFADVWLNGQSDKDWNQKLKEYNKKLENYRKKLDQYNALENKGKKKPPKAPERPERWLGYANMEHEDPYIPTLADVTTTTGRKALRENHPEALEAYLEYQKGRGSANPKVSFTHTDYRGDIMRMTATDIENVKHIGGLRIQSFSDFETVHVIDMMQAVMDMASRKLTSQAYTKVPAFADIFGGTGIKINLSLIGMVKNGKLVFDSVEGIDPKEAFRLRKKYSKNVGTIIVGANAESILAAWKDPRIDMVIPFHRSGWSTEEFEQLGLGDYKDFQEYQTERYLDGSSPNGISLADAKMQEIYSEDYWDYNKTGKENAEAYLELCAKKHYRPVFYNFLHDNGDGTWSLQKDGSTDGYWKSLVDYKMYDNDGNGAPQTEVRPIFDMRAARKVMDKFDGDPNTLPIAQDVVDRFVKEYKDTKYSLKDNPSESRSYQSTITKLENQVKDLKAEFKRTDLKTADPKDVRIQAGKLIKRHDSNMSVQGELVDTFNRIFRLYKENGTDSFDDIYEIAKNAAVEVVNNISIVHDEGAEDYKAIKEYLKETPIVITEDMKKNITDFNDFRKRYFGKLKLVNGTTGNIDNVYMELNEMFPGQFTEDYVNPADQLYHMADVLDNYAPYYETLDGASPEMQDYVVDIAADIMETAYGLQTKKTFADKKYEEKVKAVAKARQKALESRDNALNRQKQRYEKKIEDLKAHNLEMRANRKARKEDSEARTKLLKIARRLDRFKTTAAKREQIDALIGDLDLVAKGMTDKTLENLHDLRDWYSDRKETDPDFIADSNIEKKLERLSKKHIKDMDLADVRELYDVLSNIENELKTERKLINSEMRKDIKEAGRETIRDINNSKGLAMKTRGFDRFFINGTLSPLRQIRRVTGYNDNDPLYIATKELADGQRKMLDYQMTSWKAFDRFMKNKDFLRSINGPKAKEIEITGIKDGKQYKTKITPDIRMAMYLASMNADNLRHMRDGGVKLPDIKLYKKGKISEAMEKGTTVKFSPSMLNEITSHMTKTERAFAQEAYKYYNETSPEAINKVSEELKGYSIARVQNYYPIHTDSNFLSKEFEAMKFDGTIEGMGFLKERVRASNPIQMTGLVDELTRSIEMNSKYVGLAIPVRNFGKIYGVNDVTYTEREEGGVKTLEADYRGSVKDSVSDKWGGAVASYIEKFMTDLQNGRKNYDDWGNFFSKLRSNYAGAVLTLNASVALKQAASYPTAAAVLGRAPLVKAMGNFGKVDLDLIAKYTPLQWYRSQGFSTTELGDIRSGNKQSLLNKYPFLNWIQGIDLATTRKLWKASEYYVQDHNKNLKKGTDEYYKAVADIYNRVIEETQPNYTTMQRPGLLRSDNDIVLALNMFKTQPYQNFNILYDSIGNYVAKRNQYNKVKNADTKKALQDAGRDMRNAIDSQIMQLAVFAAMTSLWALFRRKDDKYRDKEGNLTFVSYLERLAKDMLANSFAVVPFGSDIYGTVSSSITGEYYYGFSSVTDSSITDLLDTFTKGYKTIGEWVQYAMNDDPEKEKPDGDMYKDIVSVSESASRFLGAPFSNMKNLATGIYGWVAISKDGEYIGTYEALKMSFAKDTEKKELLMKAYRNDSKAYEELRKMMIEDGFKEDSLDYYIRKQTRENPDESSQTRYQEMVTYLEGSPMLWTNNNSTYKEAYDKVLRDIALGIETSTTESYTKYEGIGLKPEELVLVKLAMEKADQMYGNKNGYLDTNEKEKGLDMLTHLHLTQKEKEAIKKIKFNFDKKG